MGEWMDGRMNEWVGGQMDDKWVDRLMNDE